ncbi:hypothetical protein LX36DRAFT_464348 [Colletotrichum falcatum]|nr:hypothetical protein LX36DRAFT_464348 [Colletotrichum falcatum]
MQHQSRTMCWGEQNPTGSALDYRRSAGGVQRPRHDFHSSIILFRLCVPPRRRCGSASPSLLVGLSQLWAGSGGLADGDHRDAGELRVSVTDLGSQCTAACTYLVSSTAGCP